MKIQLTLLLAILLFSCSSEPEVPEEEMPEEEIPFALEGEWVGNWSDSLFPSIGISARIGKVSGDDYAGVMFVASGSGPFNPCCGAPTHNGSITFSAKDGIISNFLYEQVAPDYRGGCPGTYTGEGEISGEFLRINFTGNDCDGFHNDGLFVWRNN